MSAPEKGGDSAGVSLCTIVRGRADHLANLMKGVAAQDQPPDELVVAYMQDAPHADLPDPGCPVRTCFVPGDPMPLAAARNRAADEARGNILLFLDVDCVPSSGFVRRYAQACAAQERAFLCEILYLPGGLDIGAPDYPQLDAAGERHPAKPRLDGVDWRDEPDHGELWGLAFGMKKALWDRAGGMDERYAGYGAEETDFAMRLKRAGVPLGWLGGARAYHQHHAVHVPPLQHFDHIVRNARLFRGNWGRWCMDYWLGQFADAGLIAMDEDTIAVRRRPTDDEIAATRQPASVRFS